LIHHGETPSLLLHTMYAISFHSNTASLLRRVHQGRLLGKRIIEKSLI
jgi:hypothetical protein